MKENPFISEWCIIVVIRLQEKTINAALCSVVDVCVTYFTCLWCYDWNERDNIHLWMMHNCHHLLFQHVEPYHCFIKCECDMSVIVIEEVSLNSCISNVVTCWFCCLLIIVLSIMSRGLQEWVFIPIPSHSHSHVPIHIPIIVTICAKTFTIELQELLMFAQLLFIMLQLKWKTSHSPPSDAELLMLTVAWHFSLYDAINEVKVETFTLWWHKLLFTIPPCLREHCHDGLSFAEQLQLLLH